MSSFIKKFSAIMLILLSGMSMTKALASHYAAVDIFVEYAGTGPTDLTYKVTIDLYFACEQGSAGPSGAGSFRYFSANAGHTPYDFSNPSVNMTWLNNNEVIIVDQLCEGYKSQNSCNDPANQQYPGFKRTRSVGTVTLPSQQSDWVFYWSSGARNSQIQNITTNGPGCNPQGNIFVDAGLDNLTRYDNSSPTFTVMPLPYLCVNQPATYLNGPFDALGDSLVTTNVIPRQNWNTFYSYCTGYTAANPVQSTTGYAVDAATGTATFTPQFTPFHVLAFRVSKYDRKTKKLLGFANRDVQVAVLNCTGQPPAVSDPQNITFGELSNDKEKFTTCSGIKFDFDIDATTTLTNRKLYMEANLANFPGASMNVIGEGTSTVKGTFTWAPHYGNIGQHVLIVTTKDSTCDGASPVVFKRHKVILLTVLPTIDAGPDKGVCMEGGSPAEIFVKGADNYRLKWTDISGGKPDSLSSDTAQLVFATPKKETTYIVSTEDLPSICKNKDTITVYIDTNNTIDAFPKNPVILCRPDYLQLEGTPYGKNTTIPPGEAPSVPFGGKPITKIGCGTADTSLSNVILQIPINGSLGTGFDTLGPLTSTFPTNATSVKQQFLIRRAELAESGMLYGTIKAISFKANPLDPTYEYSNFKISIKCTDENVLAKNKGFQTGLTQEFLATDPMALANGWNTFKFEKPYSWDTSKNLLVEICYSGNTPSAAGNPIISFVPTDYISTIMLPVSTGSACATIASTDIQQNYARPYFSFDFAETIPRDFELVWTPSTFLSDSTIAQPLAYVPQSVKYLVKTVGRSGCIVKDSVDVYVPVHNYAVWPADTAICYNEGAPMRTTGGGFTFKWYKINDKGEYEILSHTDESSCWDCANPVLKPLKTTTYKIGVYDSVWCIDTLTAKITVKPLPDIRIINRDTFVKYGQSIQLMASGARIYNWSPVGSLNNANTSYPIATPTEPTTYIAGGIGANGCRAFDTLKVDIDYRDNLFVPTGFSPNNDGKNDLFKVANLTFQKVIEFRVFNRWGQEVFMANDNRGWDGNWKGEPQDMDSYTYTIKVGFPDGYIETYRGTTTLIR